VSRKRPKLPRVGHDGRLHAAGANVQRPWASTGTKSPAYSPTLYIDELIGDHIPDATLEAFRHADGPPPRATVL